MKIKTSILAAVGALLVLLGPAAAAQDFKVVVNSSNDTTSVTKQQLSRCFMKQTATWITGQTIAPVDQAASARVREKFSADVLGRDVSAVKSYWQRQIFSGRSVPPPEKASDAEVLAFVRANPGAVGYVSAGVDLGSGVKVLSVTDD
jgi:ABC-type phosphate transport system substrate-binding protein